MTTIDTGFTWRSRPVFVLVAVGATLSLNDLLTFPVLAGQNGGGAFLLLYLLFLFVLGMPLLMSELMLGRLTRRDPASALGKISHQYRASVYWKLVGLAAMLAAFLIAATLSVVAGWSFAYSVKSASGLFVGIDTESAQMLFDRFIIDSERMALWQTLFLVVLVAICAQPINRGVERANLILVPSMGLLLVIGLIVAVMSPEFDAAIRNLLYVDFTAMDSQTPLLALQRAFYTLALGLGVMMAYGRYLPGRVSIAYCAVLILVIDLLFSILIGLSINTLVMSSGYLPGADNHFAFRLMPVIFDHYSDGQFLSALFFILLTLAALTTSIALLEGPITYLQQKQQLSRLRATVVLGVVLWAIGIGVIMAHSVWNGEGFSLALFVGNEAVRLVNNAGFHDVLIFISSHLIQPLVALLLCLLVGWRIPREVTHREFAQSRRCYFEIWNYLVRYIIPVLMLVIILAGFGII